MSSSAAASADVRSRALPPLPRSALTDDGSAVDADGHAQRGTDGAARLGVRRRGGTVVALIGYLIGGDLSQQERWDRDRGDLETSLAIEIESTSYDVDADDQRLTFADCSGREHAYDCPCWGSGSDRTSD